MSESELNNAVNGVPQRLARLEAREALEELKARYARGADAVFNQPGVPSATALADLFTEDGILDLGPFGRYEGRPALLNAFQNILPTATAWSVHYVVSPRLKISGTTAVGRWYFLIKSMPQPVGSPLIDIYGEYEDTYQHTAQGWRIAESVSKFFLPPA